ncbi:aminotransferase class-III family protein [Mycobacterium xenopi 4042]|uniref:Aminotransferase class-III family protein n=1 Tax=Mycobacterium xenopi 4042 TaxID=1299334 RepID=X8DJ69_MYCXE|nr:aminotransferase class-III family protein [Mycobacterium xenopi 4042]
MAFDHAYHGRTNLAMALTAKSAPYKNGFGPFAPEIYRAPLSYPFRDRLLDEKLASNGELAAERAIRHIDQQVGADNVAALLIEPIQGEGGFIVPARGFWPLCASGASNTTWSSSPTRSRPDSRAPGRCSPASTRALSPT